MCIYIIYVCVFGVFFNSLLACIGYPTFKVKLTLPYTFSPCRHVDKVTQIMNFFYIMVLTIDGNSEYVAHA